MISFSAAKRSLASGVILAAGVIVWISPWHFSRSSSIEQLHQDSPQEDSPQGSLQLVAESPADQVKPTDPTPVGEGIKVPAIAFGLRRLETLTSDTAIFINGEAVLHNDSPGTSYIWSFEVYDFAGDIIDQDIFAHRLFTIPANSARTHKISFAEAIPIRQDQATFKLKLTRIPFGSNIAESLLNLGRFLTVERVATLNDGLNPAPQD